jgi:hypothetical protein
VSPRSRRSARTGEWAAPTGTSSAEEDWSSVVYNHSSRHRARAPLGGHEPVHRRRAAAGRSPIGRARRRRLRLIDLGLGVALALLAILLAPGLAIVALLALVGLLACGASLAVGRVRRRRAGNHRRPRRVDPPTPGTVAR